MIAARVVGAALPEFPAMASNEPISEITTESKGKPGPGPGRGSIVTSGGWFSSLLIFVGLTLVYLGNGRVLVNLDTAANAMLPLAMLRGDGVYLDRFAPFLLSDRGKVPFYLSQFGTHLVPRYPIGPALVTLPLVAPQVLFWDRTSPGWDRDPSRTAEICVYLARRASAVLVAATGGLLFLLLRRLGLGRAAWPAVLAACLGSDFWVAASQAPWPHGPVAFCLTSTLLLLLPRPLARWRLVLAGLAATALVWCRPIDLPFALVIAFWVVWYHRRGLAWFLPFPVLGALALVGMNLWFFGTIAGGQDELEALHPILHGVPGAWSGHLLFGAAGTLFSPNRGLFVYCPWILVALMMAPFAGKRLAHWPLVRWLLWSIVPFGLILSKYAVWWGGHSFGPRYWTDVIPLFAILLAAGLDLALDRSRLLVGLMALTIAWSVGAQLVGAFCFPSTWNLHPVDVDQAHERLWDWRDTELSRCLSEWIEAARSRPR
jgi:hypothetical protein